MRGLDPSEFQLWAKTSRDEAPYPLIGHERPFAIKLSCLREGLSTEEGFDLDHCNNVHGPDPLTRYVEQLSEDIASLILKSIFLEWTFGKFPSQKSFSR